MRAPPSDDLAVEFLPIALVRNTVSDCYALLLSTCLRSLEHPDPQHVHCRRYDVRMAVCDDEGPAHRYRRLLWVCRPLDRKLMTRGADPVCRSSIFSGVFVAIMGQPAVRMGDVADVGRRVGMSFTIMSLGALAGPPISGAILDHAANDFKPVGYYAGETRGHIHRFHILTFS